MAAQKLENPAIANHKLIATRVGIIRREGSRISTGGTSAPLPWESETQRGRVLLFNYLKEEFSNVAAWINYQLFKIDTQATPTD